MTGPTDKEKELYVAIWSKTVETQMHFNEMSVKSRQLGLAFVTAALGVAVVVIGRKDDFGLIVSIGNIKFYLHVAVMIILAAALALTAVRILDLNVYHKMLRGAVSFGEDFENRYMKHLFSLEKGMTGAISHFSRHEDAKVNPTDTGYQYLGGSTEKSALVKIRMFYNVTTSVLVIVALGLFLATCSVPSQNAKNMAQPNNSMGQGAQKSGKGQSGSPNASGEEK